MEPPPGIAPGNAAYKTASLLTNLQGHNIAGV